MVFLYCFFDLIAQLFDEKNSGQMKIAQDNPC